MVGNKMIKSLAQLDQAITELTMSPMGAQCDLESYLRSFYGLLESEGRLPSYDLLAELVRQAFLHPAVPFDDAWRAVVAPPDIEEDVPGSKAVALSTLIFLISDLRRMREQGAFDLPDDVLYGGVKSPSGNLWYNFDPKSFLRCATSGALDIAGEEANDKVESICWSEVASILDLGRVYE